MKQIGIVGLTSKLLLLLFACLLAGLAASANENSEISPIQTTIKGTVFDENGQPLPGVSITEKGTSNVVVTDFEGSFSITTKTDSATLVASSSYIGYKTQEVLAKSDVEIHMMLESQVLRGIAVIGQQGAGQANTNNKKFTFPVKVVAESFAIFIAELIVLATTH